MNIMIWRDVPTNKVGSLHMITATLNVQISETINEKVYTAKRVRTIHCAITDEEQGEIIEEMTLECRRENRLTAKLDN